MGKVTVKAKGKTVSKNAGVAQDLAQAVDTFADAIVSGETQSRAYQLSHPHCHKQGKALSAQGYEWAHRPDVVAAVELRRNEMRARAAGFRDRLVDHLVDDIETSWRDNGTLGPVMDQVKTATKVLGMEKQTVDVQAKVGPIDDSSAADKINFLLGEVAKISVG